MSSCQPTFAAPPPPPPLPPAVDARNPPARMNVSLPGVPSTAPFEYYSGFLDAGVPPSGRGTMYFHYICAMAPDWRTKPLTIWYNGGPGAPSTYGLFQEFGPFLLTAESYETDEYRRTGLPTPIANPWSWSNLTSVCEIDSPPPVGASYCTEGNGSATSTGGPSGDAYTCGPWSDATTAAANHRAHQALFTQAFPEFEASQQPVFLTGESYAGIYVPLFVDAWLADPVVGPGGRPINFGGFAVGDGFPGCVAVEGKPVDWCVDLENVAFFKYPNALPGPFWDVEFFHGHSQMSESLYRRIQTNCSAAELKGRVPLGASCLPLLDEMSQEVGFFYAYNLDEACADEVPAAAASRRRMLAGSAGRPVRRRTHAAAPGDGDTGLGAPCLGAAMDDYFASNTTKQAMGIPLDNNFIVLDNGIGFNYTTDAPFVGHVYRRAAAAGKRILVYEGDTDACGLQTAPIEDIWVPYFGGAADAPPDGWTPVGPYNTTAASAPLGLPQTQKWRPFGVEPAGRKVQGGFVIEWAGGNVSFASVRGAGHLLPLYRPAASYTLMKAFLEGKSPPPAFYPK